jgi:hypothetical protein
MSQEDLVISIFCLIDDQLKVLGLGRLRQRGPRPTLADSEVLAIVSAGELFGLDTDQAIFTGFREHFAHLFPALTRLHRGTFVRQAANLWGLAQRLQQRLAQTFLAEQPQPPLWILDSFPLPACRFARAQRCKRLAGLAARGYDGTIQAVFYGLRVHLRLADAGVIVQLELAPANVHDAELVPELLPADGVPGLGDRNYWKPPLQAELAAAGQRLLAPFHQKRRDPWPRFSKLLSRLRQVIEPVIGQLAERLHAKRTWARDLWHLCARLGRKVLAHTAAVLLNARLGHPPLQLELLLPK